MVCETAKAGQNAGYAACSSSNRCGIYGTTQWSTYRWQYAAIHGKDRQRCGAIGKHAAASANPRPTVPELARPGKTRCRFHGGLSTGPRTPEGKAAVVTAMQEGRRRRIAELATQGEKIRTGRRSPKPRLSPDGTKNCRNARPIGEERRAEEIGPKPRRRQSASGDGRAMRRNSPASASRATKS